MKSNCSLNHWDLALNFDWSLKTSGPTPTECVFWRGHNSRVLTKLWAGYSEAMKHWWHSRGWRQRSAFIWTLQKGQNGGKLTRRIRHESVWRGPPCYRKIPASSLGVPREKNTLMSHPLLPWGGKNWVLAGLWNSMKIPRHENTDHNSKIQNSVQQQSDLQSILCAR